MERYSADLCLGRIVPEDGAPVYIGRLGLTDHDGERLLVDWRSPAAEPFFAATHAHPMGLESRRRYRWRRGVLTDFWDEVFTADALHSKALDDQSAFIASLSGSRTDRMADVLGTIQADQDAIVRAASRGTLVVDGGPGTGKTVVALHRTAYLLYADPRLGHRRGGVLFIGPHQPYLNYVSDVLPSLGEEGVRTCTLKHLVPEGTSAIPEDDVRIADLKADLRMVEAIEPAVAFSEETPTEALLVETSWGDVLITPADWAEAFATPDPGTPHNEAREEIWTSLLDQVSDDNEQMRRALSRNDELRSVFDMAWPVLDAPEVIADLWSVPAYLRLCAPWLSDEQVKLLQRDPGSPWTEADLPLLDAARARIGDPALGDRRRRQQAERAAHREEMSRVVDHLIANDDSEMKLMSTLRVEDMQGALDEDIETATPDELAGPFAHVVVDEAQELNDAEWQMVLRRCPSRSLTLVGDRAQARHGFAGSWEERLARAGIDRVRMAGLSINYRTPSEVMEAAEPVIRAVSPDANVPTSIRSNGIPVEHKRMAELDTVIEGWLEENQQGTIGVIGMHPPETRRERVQSLTPTLAKGLEFDLVILLDPIDNAVDRYVAMTRATRQLVVLT